jgi:membrane protease YdiL (CAAX protease family)
MEHESEGGPLDQEPGAPEFGIFERVNNYLLLLYAVACFLMYISLWGLLVLRDWYIPALIAPTILALIVPMFLLSRRFSLSFTREYRLGTPRLVMSALALIVAGCSILPVDALSSFLERRRPPDADYITFLLSIKPKGIPALIATAFGTVIATPFGEELLFRGFIQRIFQRNMHRQVAVVLAAVVFSLCHSSLTLLPGAFILGIVLGYLFYRTGNLIYPTMAHALYNLVSLIRLHAMPESAIKAAEIELPPASWTILSVAGLVVSVVLIERFLPAAPRQ